MPFEARSPDGLFATAKRLGFRTEMAGYYFAYCHLLAPLVDSCQSFSFYNASSVDAAFSPLDAIETTLILWPRQFPFGLIKNPAFARQQRQLVEATWPMAIRPLPVTRPVFRLIHFSVPHLPFVFDRNGYRPSYDPLRTSPDDRYVHQLAYVDGLVDRLSRELARDRVAANATMVLLADHGFRFGGRETDPLHIPFIVKRADQAERRDVTTAERGETLLRQVVMEACTGTPASILRGDQRTVRSRIQMSLNFMLPAPPEWSCSAMPPSNDFGLGSVKSTMGTPLRRAT